MTHFALKDELLDAQALRVAGTAPYGGADVGECLRAAAGVRGTDLTSWHTAWTLMAASALSLAESQQAAGRLHSARLAFFRASSYFRTAGVMLLGAPLDSRLVESYASRRPLSGPAPRYSSDHRRSSRSRMRPRLCPGTSFAPGLKDLREKRGRRSSSQAAMTAQPKSCTSPTAPPRSLAGTTCLRSTGRVRERRCSSVAW